MKKIYLFLLIFCICFAGFAQTSTFIYTGSMQPYNVPLGVTSVSVDVRGAQGGNFPGEGNGGLGGRVTCNLTVTPGTTLYVYVGQQAANSSCGSGSAGGSNSGGGGQGGNGATTGCGGSGGGGSSDIRTTSGSTTAALNSRLVVGGGGSGGAWDYGETGANAGGAIGSNGVDNGPSGAYGYGGTQLGGGNPGCDSYYGFGCGVAGAQGAGGAAPSGSYGSGGGGGYWGGGGGSAGSGGGGSSFPITGTVTAPYASVANTGGFQTGNGQVSITVLCASPGTISGNAPICMGSTATLTETSSGGTWSASPAGVININASTGAITALSAGTTTVKYNVNNPCGALASVVVTVNPTPTAITGTANVCTTLITPLSSSPSGGTWTSSNNGQATVDGGGNVTGVAAGTPNIVYTLPGGCNVSQAVVVNTNPAPITGQSSVCTSQSTPALGELTTGGTWSSSFSSIASVSPTGVVSGLVAGPATILYTLSDGCFASLPFTVNPLPNPIGGTLSVCTGSTTNLTDAGGGTWSSSNLSAATVVSAVGVVSGINAGTTIITYTLPGGCLRSATVTVNSTPLGITGITNVCVGATTTLSSPTTGGVWSSGSAAAATVNTLGVVSGVSAGTPNISYTLSTGCATGVPVQVNPLPSLFTITGGGAYCAGGNGVHIGLSYANTGVTYSLFNGAALVPPPVEGSNSGLDFGLITTTGTYTVSAISSAGCASAMPGSVTVSVSSLPAIHTVSGSGNYCPGGSGVAVIIDGSDAGASYQLYSSGVAAGAPVTGTGSSLNFGMQPAGAYTVIATNGAGCSRNMAGSAVIGISALPTVYTLGGGGSLCVGGTGQPMVLSGSDIGTNYQLYNDGIASGLSRPGTGSAINFGPVTTAGSYTVVANNPVTTCSANMPGNPVITVNSLPAVYTVTGGGNFCAGTGGVHVVLSFSDPGFKYQLYNGGPAGTGTEGASEELDFGLQTAPGAYTVVATNDVTGCSSNMSGSAVVTVSSLPNAFPVTGGGGYCPGTSGAHITLGGSTSGFKYQLYFETSPAGGVVTGTGGSLDLGAQTAIGSYKVVATNPATGCTNNMSGTATITLNSAPAVHNVIEEGTSFCQGGAGIDISLDGSDNGISYQLYRGTSPVGSGMPGTTGSIDFGSQPLAGIYTVVGTNGSGCNTTMTGTAPVSINPLPTVYTVTGGGGYCPGGSGVHIGLSGSNAGTSYQLLNDNSPLGSLVEGTGIALDFGYQTLSGTYTVAASNDATGCGKNMAGIATIVINSAPGTHGVTGGGNYCAGGAGSDIMLDGSDFGINYQLFNGTVSVPGLIAGTGTTLDLGIHPAGSYTVVAINASTGCNGDMTGSATIGVNPAPAAYPLTGTGNYCSDDPGADIQLSNSDTGISYQLQHLGGPIGSAMPGSGSSIDFGAQPLTGAYTVVATDTTTGCTANMTGSITVTVTTRPTAFTVTGGGNYCSGGTGMPVGLSNSNNGISYQLYNGGTAVGGIMSGTGGIINFGNQTVPGNYTVVASPGGTCPANMTGSAIVGVNALPAMFTITIANGGNYCTGSAGVDISLSGSATGITYQLYNGSVAVDTAMNGTTSVLDFGAQTAPGAYSVVATDPFTGCTSRMTGSGAVSVSLASLPHVFNVTGGGNYCAGGPGVAVTLSSSNTDINYQLYHSGIITGSPLPGTGTLLDFGMQTAAGNYTVIATDAYTTCTNKMADTATVAVNPILSPVVTITPSSTSIAAGQKDTFTVTVTNGGSASYQWLVNEVAVAGATGNKFVTAGLSTGDSVTCEVTSGSPCGGITVSKSVSVTVIRNTTGVAVISSSGGDITLIPNPNKGLFTIKGTLGTVNDEEVSLEITDMVGHVVYTNKVMATGGNINEKIQLNNTLANGMYLLSLYSVSDNEVFHFVIEQ